MRLPRTKFRSFHSTMTKIFPSNSRRLFSALTVITLGSSGALAQTSVAAPAPAVAPPASATPLTLGDAARLAAHQSALAQGARLRADEAGAPLPARRAALLPTGRTYTPETGRTLYTSTPRI